MLKIIILLILLENWIWTKHEILSIKVPPYQLILVAIERVLVYVRIF